MNKWSVLKLGGCERLKLQFDNENFNFIQPLFNLCPNIEKIYE